MRRPRTRPTSVPELSLCSPRPRQPLRTCRCPKAARAQELMQTLMEAREASRQALARWDGTSWRSAPASAAKRLEAGKADDAAYEETIKAIMRKGHKG